MNLQILKCHGSGNDFILVDEMEGLLFTEPERVLLARLLCDRRGILGSDGILFVQGSARADVKMRMFNPDGSEPQTCGNGLRCVARFAAERLNTSALTIETMRGISATRMEPDISHGVRTSSVELSPLSMRPVDLPLLIGADTLIDSLIGPLSGDIRFTAVSAPNPHLIAIVDKIESDKLLELGQRASQLPDILPERANVSFCTVVGAQKMAVETYERGTGLTLSCGSAMAASALVACVLGHADFDDWLLVYNRGGFVKAKAYRIDTDGYGVRLCGNATFVYSATIPVDLEAQTLPQYIDMDANVEEITAYSAVAEVGRRVMGECTTQCGR